MRKYTDLVFYRLYKRIPFVQKPTSAAKRLLAPFAYLLFTIYFCLETDQMRSNAAKCGQAQRTFADGLVIVYLNVRAFAVPCTSLRQLHGDGRARVVLRPSDWQIRSHIRCYTFITGISSQLELTVSCKYYH
jgi:hypothetical protein